MNDIILIRTAHIKEKNVPLVSGFNYFPDIKKILFNGNVQRCLLQ